MFVVKEQFKDFYAQSVDLTQAFYRAFAEDVFSFILLPNEFDRRLF